jgi:hypothetical protein
MDYPLRPQPDLDEKDPKVLHAYIRELHDERATAYAQFSGGKEYPRRPQIDRSETDPQVLHDYIGSVHEELTDAYHPLSDKQGHTRECPVSQGYVYRPGPCNCDAPPIPLR